MSRSDLPGARPPTDGTVMAALVCSVAFTLIRFVF